MNTWVIVLLVILAVYVIGAVGFYLWLPTSSPRLALSVLWPFVVVWMLIGSIQ